MIIQKNNILKRAEKKPILWDAFYYESQIKKPLLIFCHGYKGFKDWGAWDLVANAFAKANFVFVKFNFSHNGGTIEQPIDFPDLEAFANNNYSLELEDLNDMITFILKNDELSSQIDTENITLIGHSRGGGIVAIQAEKDKRITNLITWASVADYAQRFSKATNLMAWKEKGVRYVINARTKQKMPHYYQFYEDFLANEERLTISRAVKNLRMPHLIIHGTKDAVVPFSDAETLHQWNPDSKLYTINNANHVFGASHPWEENELPEDLNKVIQKTIAFI